MLAIIFILVLLLIAYIHFMQGLFSGFISAVLAVLAGAIAFNYYEPLAGTLSGGKFNDQAQGICMIALFAMSYLVFRSIFDALIPGNIRLNSTVDKVGGAVFGLFAGMIALGIVTLGAQSFPFGPSIGGYSRYALKAENRSVPVPPASGEGRTMDRRLNDELDDKVERLETAEQQSMLIPFDNFVIALYSNLSEGGSLDAEKPFRSIHPDLPQELFAQRIGVEAGARHTVSLKKEQQANLGPAVNILPSKPGLEQTSAELQQIRKIVFKNRHQPEADRVLVAVPVSFNIAAADEMDGADRFVRIGASGVRLVTKDANGEWKNFYPLGTLEDSKLWVNRPDDFMFINVGQSDAGARFVFEIPTKALGDDPKQPKFVAGSFIEVKRTAKLALDVPVVGGYPKEDPKYWPLRKNLLKKARPKPTETPEVATNNPPTPPTPPTPDNTTPTPPTPPTPDNTTPTPPPAIDNGWDAAPLSKPEFVAAGATLPIPIDVGAKDADLDVLSTSVEGVVKGRKFVNFATFPTVPEAAPAELAKNSPVKELFAPAGQRIVQVKLTPKNPAELAWLDQLGEYTVVDQSGTAHKPRGGLTIATTPKGQRVLAHYESAKEVPGLPKPEGASSAPSVTLFYVIPAASKATEIRFQGKEGGIKLEK